MDQKEILEYTANMAGSLAEKQPRRELPIQGEENLQPVTHEISLFCLIKKKLDKPMGVGQTCFRSVSGNRAAALSCISCISTVGFEFFDHTGSRDIATSRSSGDLITGFRLSLIGNPFPSPSREDRNSSLSVFIWILATNGVARSD
jgi:hypothetical protein